MTETTVQYSQEAKPPKRVNKTGIIATILASAGLGILVAIFAVMLGRADGQSGNLQRQVSHDSAVIAQLQSEQASLSKAQQTSKSAEIAHLGFCYSVSTYTTVDGPGNLLTDLNIYSPVLTAGVPSCPSGNFVSVVPGS